jgi:glycosyltransferase involved in cell wall biosynthesis
MMNGHDLSTAGVSVIICCYNSAARLPQTLAHLARQQMPEGFLWEIVVVNNASTDNTVACAKDTWESLGRTDAGFRIVEEPRPGQMYARKTGVREAFYDCMVFCDDDNWLGEQYVYLAFRSLQRDQAIGAAGGQNLPVTDATAYPDWWEADKDKYATGIPASASGDVSQRGFLLGAGLVTRKSLFLRVFDDRYPSILNGRNGEQLSTGDDFEYCKRLLLWEYSLYYEEGMRLQHFIPRERLTPAYRERLLAGIAQATKVLDEYDLALWLKRKNRHKNKLRLFIMSPFRWLFSRLGLSGRRPEEEAGTFFYSAPIPLRASPARRLIKKFMNHQ